MSKDWFNDMNQMHQKYDVHTWVGKQLVERNYDNLRTFLEFRINFLEEELNETRDAFVQGDSEEVVDGLIDLCVIAIGTLDLLGVDAYKAWDQVLRANMAKEVGVKASRPNPLGLPDLVKPEGWVGPDHSDNHGHLPVAFTEESELKW